MKKKKENKKAGAEKSQQSAPKCLHPLTFWPSTLEEAEGRSDVTLSTLSPWKCHFFTGRQRRGRRSAAALLDVPVSFFISEGFAGAALQSDGFLLFFLFFFTPSQPLSASFYLLLFSFIPQSPLLTRSSCPETRMCFLRRPPRDHWFIQTLHVWSEWSILWSAMNLCLQPCFFFKFLRLDRRGGKWSEGRRTADFCFCPGLAVLELLTSFRLYFPPLAKPGADGNAALCLPECSQCIRFPVQRARAGKQKQTGSEGRGKWEVTEVRAWRAQMGNGGRMHVGGGGECGEMKVTHGSCYYGSYAFHVWLSCVTMINTKFNVTATHLNFAWRLKVL